MNLRRAKIELDAAAYVARRTGLSIYDPRIRHTYIYTWKRLELSVRQLGRDIVSSFRRRTTDGR